MSGYTEAGGHAGFPVMRVQPHDFAHQRSKPEVRHESLSSLGSHAKNRHLRALARSNMATTAAMRSCNVTTTTTTTVAATDSSASCGTSNGVGVVVGTVGMSVISAG